MAKQIGTPKEISGLLLTPDADEDPKVAGGDEKNDAEKLTETISDEKKGDCIIN